MSRTTPAYLRDPVTGDHYPKLEWSDIGLHDIAENKNRQTVALAHFAIVERAMSATTVADRLTLLATAIAHQSTDWTPTSRHAR